MKKIKNKKQKCINKNCTKNATKFIGNIMPVCKECFIKYNDEFIKFGNEYVKIIM